MRRKKWLSLRLACLTLGPFFASSSVSFLSGVDFNWVVFWCCLSFLLILNVLAADFYERNT